MGEKEILRLFNARNTGSNPISKVNNNDLKAIYKYLKLKLKNNTNWSKKKYYEFIIDYNINDYIFRSNLFMFISVYEKKIQELKTLNKFYNDIKELKRFYTPSHDVRFKLKESTDIKVFMRTLILLKSHINITDEQFINLISSSINTGLKRQTLLTYYYQIKRIEKLNFD